MQIMQGELFIHYFFVVDRYFDATNTIKYMQLPVYHWRKQNKNNW